MMTVLPKDCALGYISLNVPFERENIHYYLLNVQCQTVATYSISAPISQVLISFMFQACFFSLSVDLPAYTD